MHKTNNPKDLERRTMLKISDDLVWMASCDVAHLLWTQRSVDWFDCMCRKHCKYIDCLRFRTELNYDNPVLSFIVGRLASDRLVLGDAVLDVLSYQAGKKMHSQVFVKCVAYFSGRSLGLVKDVSSKIEGDTWNTLSAALGHDVLIRRSVELLTISQCAQGDIDAES